MESHAIVNATCAGASGLYAKCLARLPRHRVLRSGFSWLLQATLFARNGSNTAATEITGRYFSFIKSEST